MQDSVSTLPVAGRHGHRRGTRIGRGTMVTAMLAVVTVAASACQTADAANKANLPKPGGTLNVILSVPIAHLDPQQISTATDYNIARLFTRTLTTYRAAPGAAGSQIVPDLATDTGRPSQNNTVWDFTLKDGVKWQDGSPITCDQVKYGVERSYSSLLQDGLKYTKQYLVDNAGGYQGPYASGPTDDLKSVVCVSTKTIQFHLKQPVGDFGYAVSTPTFAPVPPSIEGKDRLGYDNQPFSDGPYKIQPGATHEKMTLVRNNFWDPATDPIRHQYPDRIDISVNDNTPEVTNNLIQSQGQYQYSINIDADVAPNFVQQVLNDPALSARVVTGPAAIIRYFAINTRRITDVNCRKALVYAFNKRRYLRAMGGSAFGDIATTMIPPGLAAHQDFDLYNSLANPEGNPDQAQQLVAGEKGKCPTSIRVAFPDNPAIRARVATLVDAYQAAGIGVVLVPLAPGTYFSTGIGNPHNTYDLMYAGWVPDFPNGSAVIPPLFDGRQIPTSGDSGNLNFSLLDDPDINALIDQAFAESDLTKQYRLWGQLDQKIAELAPTIPVIYQKPLRMEGTKVRGAYISPAFAEPDLVSLGVAP